MSRNHGSWNPWKMTAIGLALAVATALVTGVVVANWYGGAADPKVVSSPRAGAPRVVPTQAVPTQAAIESCNQYAATRAGARDKTGEVVKDTALGALIGAAVGAAGGAVADGGKGAGKGAAIGGIVGAGGGTLYGLNENRRQDERYREAYAACMRDRGYAG